VQGAIKSRSSFLSAPVEPTRPHYQPLDETCATHFKFSVAVAFLLIFLSLLALTHQAHAIEDFNQNGVSDLWEKNTTKAIFSPPSTHSQMPMATAGPPLRKPSSARILFLTPLQPATYVRSFPISPPFTKPLLPLKTRQLRPPLRHSPPTGPLSLENNTPSKPLQISRRGVGSPSAFLKSVEAKPPRRMSL
jgi:hypothetical protein